MTLDIPTLYVVSIIAILVATTAFVLEVTSRGRSPVDLIWTLAFVAALSTGLWYLAAGWSPSLWWFVALGNASSVITTFAMWNGVRADDGRRPLLGVTGAAAAVTALAALLPGPAGGEWAGGWAMLLGTAVGAGLGGAAGLRGRLRHHRLGSLLSGVLLVVALYYTVRAALFLAAGPESPAFDLYVGTANTTLVVLVLVTTAGYCMVAIRADEVHARRAEGYRFDPDSGLRTPVTFAPMAREAVRAAQGAGEPVTLVAVAVEGTEHLRTGFHREAAHEALALAVDVTRQLAPPAALPGREDATDDAFLILLPGHTSAAAHSWAEVVRRRVIATPLDLEGTRVRLRVSLAVAGDAECGYDLETLQATASRRLERALEAGGNQVLSWY